MSQMLIGIENMPKAEETAEVIKQFSEEEQREMLFYMQVFSQGVKYGMSKAQTVTIEQYLFFKVIVFIIVLIFALIWWIKERR